MFLVIAVFVVDAVRYLWLKQGWAGLLSTAPFYNPRTFDLRAVGTATSLAALTYIGFDGITTLAEDVKEPKRTVPLAVVLVCLLIGICVGLQVYLAQRAWPDYTTFKDPDTAFFDVCSLVGGKFMFYAMTIILAVACLGSALTGQVGAARILFGMGRDNALPRFFARLDRRDNPVLNIWLIGLLALIGGLLLNYEEAATLINFGAFLAFMGVNLSVVREFFFRPPAGHVRTGCWTSLCPRWPSCSACGFGSASHAGQSRRRHLVRTRPDLYGGQDSRLPHPARHDGPKRLVTGKVCDAATWSAVVPLSQKSVAHGGKLVEFPDFTRGQWKKTPPLLVYGPWNLDILDRSTRRVARG